MLHCMKLIEFFDPYLYLTIKDAINDIERGNYDNVSEILYCSMIKTVFKLNCFLNKFRICRDFNKWKYF